MNQKQSLKEQIDPEIKSLLLANEHIIVSASQNRLVPGGSINTPNAVYITNIRVLYKDPRWLGMKADIVDVSYKDISNTRLKRGVFSTEIYLKARHHSDEVRLPAMGKNIAPQIHSMIQKGVRYELPGQNTVDGELQDSGSAHLNQSLVNNEGKSRSDLLERLEKLADMRQKGILTDEEFLILKSDIMKEASE